MALSGEQRKVLRQLQAAPSYRKATPKVRKALIEAALVESGMRDLNYGDRDSVGVLQQRPSQGWGPGSESVSTDAEQFLQRAIPLRKKYGSAGALAQAVQRSAYPERYNQRSSEAERILGRSPGPSGSAASGPGVILTGGGGGGLGASQGNSDTLALLQGMLEQQKPQIQSAGLATPAHSAQAPLPEGYQSPASGGGPAPPPDINPLLAAIQTSGEAPQAPEGSSLQVLQGAGRAPSSSGGGGGRRKSGELKELFWQGPGGINVDNGRRVPQGFVKGHTSHVHVAAGPKQVDRLGRLAQEMGLRVGENETFDRVDPVHTKGSFHYRDRAIDVSGDKRKLAAYARRVARLYGV